MSEMKRHGQVGVAALRSGMHRNTASRYLENGQLPSETKMPRNWRTRENPFAFDWPDLEAMLECAPELEAKTLFDDLVLRHPDRYQEGQLRTLQRHVRQWRAEHGPSKEVFFEQSHVAGEAMQTDFTNANELGVTIGGEIFDHLLGHSVLPYSNWQSAVVCLSESMLALRRVIQTAVTRLGHVPEFHQTDNSTAATHSLSSSSRKFNEEYRGLMRHFGMKPRTIAVGESHQNGDVEALNGALKRRLEQHFLVRGHRNFPSVEAYEAWIAEVIEQANRLRSSRLKEDLEAMRSWSGNRLPEYRLERVRVRSRSTIRIRNNTYSVPSRLIGEEVDTRLFDDRLEVYFRGNLQLATPRLLGQGKSRVNYRHIIESLVKKPGAFRRYSFRESLFPSLVFRKAYDRLSSALSGRQADLDYLRILQLSATTMECEVQAALELFEEQDRLPRFDEIEAIVSEATRPEVPYMAPYVPDLSSYDALLLRASN